MKKNKITDKIKNNKTILIAAAIILIIIIVLVVVINNSNSEYHEMMEQNFNLSFENYSNITKNEINEYDNIYVTEADLVNYYYKYFIKQEVENPEIAYEMLTEDTQKQFTGIDDYKKYLKRHLIKDVLKNEVVEYRIKEKTNRVIDIIDTEDDKYTIYEDATWGIHFEFKKSIETY